MTELVPPPGRTKTRAWAMNDFGDVVGHAFTLNNWNEQAILWKEGAPPTVLDTTSQLSWAVAVNNSNPRKVAGIRKDGADALHHAVVFKDGGGVTDLHPLIGSPFSRASDINDDGLLVGDAGSRGGIGKPFLCDTTTDEVSFLPLPARYGFGLPAQVTNARHVAGIAYNDEPSLTSTVGVFLADGDQIVEQVGVANSAWGLNDADTIVGSKSFNPPAQQTAYRFKPGKAGGFENIGHSPVAGYNASLGRSINNRDEVVGYSFAISHDNEDTSIRRRAFVDSPVFGRKDIADVVDDATGWKFEEAVAINSSGMIAGTGRFQGKLRGFLLTPVPVWMNDFAELSDRYAIRALMILGGVEHGAPGWIIPYGGPPIPIPGGWRRLPAQTRDLLLGLVLSEVAPLVTDRASREAVEKAAAVLVDASRSHP